MPQRATYIIHIYQKQKTEDIALRDPRRDCRRAGWGSIDNYHLVSITEEIGIHLIISVSMPVSCNLSINKPWETLSNALKSKTAVCIDTPLSIDAIKLLVFKTNWVAQERPLLKPCGSGHKTPSRIGLRLLSTMCSSSLQAIHVKETGLWFPESSLSPFLKMAPH